MQRLLINKTFLALFDKEGFWMGVLIMEYVKHVGLRLAQFIWPALLCMLGCHSVSFPSQTPSVHSVSWKKSQLRFLNCPAPSELLSQVMQQQIKIITDEDIYICRLQMDYTFNLSNWIDAFC